MRLTTSVAAPGQVHLEWAGPKAPTSLLIVRTGRKPSFTSLRLSAGCKTYTLKGLGLHQRYRFAVLKGEVSSEWQAVTPNEKGAPVQSSHEPIGRDLARIEECFVMPQDQRLTVFWRMGAGFGEHVRVIVKDGARVVHEQNAPAEIASLAVRELKNDTLYSVTVSACFADMRQPLQPLRARPAPLGQERAANVGLPGLIFRYSTLAEEADCFGDGPVALSSTESIIVCGQCHNTVRWDAQEFRCSACRSAYVTNAFGAYLNVATLRFGTCLCCSPKKILIQRQGDDALRCAHSQKEHLREGQRHLLIEDLPHGLCQCCRPRRPLLARDGDVRCAKSNEQHQRDGVGYVLAPTQAVFDASSIDALLDAGLAEISASGISQRRPR